MNEADYIIENQCTIRECAKYFKVGKTTVHTDLSVRLPKINGSIYWQVYKILQNNWDEKALRGGAATSRMFKERRYKDTKLKEV